MDTREELNKLENRLIRLEDSHRSLEGSFNDWLRTVPTSEEMDQIVATMPVVEDELETLRKKLDGFSVAGELQLYSDSNGNIKLFGTPWSLRGKVEQSPDPAYGYKVRIWKFSWIRNASSFTSPVDSGKNYYTLDCGAPVSAIRYVVATLTCTDTDYDPHLAANSIVLSVETTEKNNGYQRTLALIVTDTVGDVVVISQKIQGDINDYWAIPDHETSKVGAKSNTIEYNPSVWFKGGYGDLVLFNSTDTNWNPRTGLNKRIPFLWQEDNNDDSYILWAHPDYEPNTEHYQTSMEIRINARGTEAITGYDWFMQLFNFDRPATSAITAMAATDYILINRFTEGGANPDRQDLKYELWTEFVSDMADALNAGTAGSQIEHHMLDFSGYDEPPGTGISDGNTDHDDSYWHAYADGSGHVGHTAFVDDHDYHTTGEVRADDFIIQDRVANAWNAADLTADVTAAISLTAGTKFDILGSTVASTITAAGLTIKPVADGVGALIVGNTDFTWATIAMEAATTMTILAGTNFDVTATAGRINLTAGAASTWLMNSVLFKTESSGNLEIGNSTYRWNTAKLYAEGLDIYSGGGVSGVRMGVSTQNMVLYGDNTAALYLGEAGGTGFSKVYLNGKEIKQILQSEFDPMAHKLLVVDA